MTAIKDVSRFEADLLRILRFALGVGTAAQGRAALLRKADAPRCLSRTAVALIKDTLARGCVRLMARNGGWRRERFLRSNQIADGRLWQRSPVSELGLYFSRDLLGLLIWLTAEKINDKSTRRRTFVGAEEAPADGFVCYHLLDALREIAVAPGLVRRLGFGKQTLCRLAFPEDFGERPQEDPPDFSPWTQGLGACMLETMQQPLALHWLRAENGKQGIADWQKMQALGRAQEMVLHHFLSAVETAGRLDLARFLLILLAELLPDNVTPARWVGGLTTAGPRLADRAATYRAALVVVRQLPRLQQWQRQAQAVGYFEENYAASQLWKSDWEHWQGDRLVRQADRLFRELGVVTP